MTFDVEKDIKEKLNSGEYRLIFNQDYETYLGDLEQELEDANNSFNGSDGEIPVRIVRIIDDKGLLITFSGRSELKDLRKDVVEK